MADSQRVSSRAIDRADAVLTWPIFVLFSLLKHWSCRESNPMLYQAICFRTAGSFHQGPFQSRSLSASSLSGLDGVKTGRLTCVSKRGGSNSLSANNYGPC
ncbi:MAG: hypothetical protein QOC63_3143 [Mycobacterium sp.]|jgi:hypothetical protein|nr:hypothetical protein [Mycobacterium sp.]